MISIIKHATKHKIKCKCTCGCLFSFEETDLKPQKTQLKKAIDCPQCGHEIIFFNESIIFGEA